MTTTNEKHVRWVCELEEVKAGDTINGLVLVKEKDFNVIWKCNKCGGLMEHQKEIHTFVCPRCGHRDWYPERQDDKSLTKEGE